MKIDFGVYCLGYNVGGHDYPFEFEVDDNELEGMTNDEKYDYIYKVCWEYLIENLELCLDINED